MVFGTHYRRSCTYQPTCHTRASQKNADRSAQTQAGSYLHTTLVIPEFLPSLRSS